MRTTTFRFAVLGGLGLLAVAALMPSPGPGAVRVPAALSQPVQAADVGFAVLPEGSVAGTAGVGKAAYVGRFRQ